MATLADLQTERAKLKAAEAKHAFEEAYAETCSKDELLAAATAARSAMLGSLSGMGCILSDAVSGEADETRVHYLLSDAVHTFLSELGDRLAQDCAALPVAADAFRRGTRPRELLSVSKWADKKREIKTGTNKPGNWSTDTTPYLREIMDSLSEHSPVSRVSFKKCSGVGGSEAGYNWIGYIVDHLQNKDMLLVVPSLELRDREFNPRLRKMFAETSALAQYVTDASRDKRNRDDLFEYGAMARIIKAGANSPNSLRASHIPYVYKSEVDGFPWDVGGEGDPDMLIENRQRTFTRAKTYEESTPTADGVSRIDIAYKQGDQRQYHVPCPECGELQVLEWGGKDAPYGIKFRRTHRRDGDTGPQQVEAAWYVCKHCACIINEGSKPDMLAKGKWIPQRPWIKHHRSYHINGIYAPLGLGLSWVKIAQRWINSQGDSKKLKAFWNTDMGEVFSDASDDIEDISLISRLEDYPARDALPIALITSWTDVQKDRLETTIIGWGAGEEAWVMGHEITPADTARVELWQDDLDAIHADYHVTAAGIDARYNTDAVHIYCKTRRYCSPTQGMEGWRPIVEDEKKRRQRLRVKRKKGMANEPIGTWSAKALIYSRLKLIVKPGDPFPQGYIHWPRDPSFDDEYFAQVASEKLVTLYKGTRPTQEWQQKRPRNEALDCLVGNLAIMRITGNKLEPPSKETQAKTETKAAARPAPKSPQQNGGGAWL